jgi:UDP-N-acetylglucosamine--N-acetylmuramyl-(pentapeptide) pyrophosphoryl-undecaprenol N-acetylglucosamine transferase
MRTARVVISGGGTGGHLFPALVLGRKLAERDPNLALTFVGSGREAERAIMARHGAEFVAMKIEGLKGRGLRSLRGLVLLPGAFLRSLALLVRFRPRLVVGVGGYSSGPIVLLASLLRIPTLILEQNARPGFTNRMLLRWVRKAVAAFDSSLPAFRGKGVALGNPVRDEFYALMPKRHEDGRLSLLVFGGSQGSHFLNTAMAAALLRLAGAKERLTIAHQTGPADLDAIAAEYRRRGFEAAEVAPFFDRMADRFAKADLIISRAGATSCAEIIAARRAAILVPFAGAADDHQTQNARILEAAGAAELLPEDERTADRLVGRILDFVDHPGLLSGLEKNLDPLRKPDAAERIAALCFELMEKD